MTLTARMSLTTIICNLAKNVKMTLSCSELMKSKIKCINCHFDIFSQITYLKFLSHILNFHQLRHSTLETQPATLSGKKYCQLVFVRLSFSVSFLQISTTQHIRIKDTDRCQPMYRFENDYTSSICHFSVK
jgi:hypothetical protein